MTREKIKQRIEFLKTQIVGDMFHDMKIKDEIHNLQMKLDGVKPIDSKIECEGCGS